MLRWAVGFLILAMVAGFLGFGGVAAISANIAQTLFIVFLVLFLAAAAIGVFNGKKPTIE